uniref:Neuromedin U receptor 3 n=1 Tax=Paramormyrops kingsleyae TaxID=1676925 RepID=A0A3B3SHK8_9TELE|nr:neuromedin-U receptor 2-like [Paramormyrops kingsleyae]XP_023683281.1 neuromedin-U receptor 2-like [Paramormyrops kingsleyae]XP_023683282.1 neuromedin-U receptor 2-like [Paramormyrops kingsleyae]
MAQSSQWDVSQNCSDLHHLLCNGTMNNSLGSHSQSLEDILLSVLGPRRSSFFLPVSLTYLLIFTVGVTGNLLTCTVIAKHQKMRTPTNLYLFSLAVSDLLVLIFGMPLEIYDMWQNYPFPFGEGGCYFKIFLFETVCFASILNVTALSMERYIAVMHPLKSRYVMTNQHARRVITGVWVVSFICAIPNTSLHGIYYLYLPEKVAESAICSLLKPLWMYNLVIQITTVLFYFVPMTIISVLYLVIGRRLNRENRVPKEKLGGKRTSGATWKIHLECDRRRQVNKMLTVVVVVFAICWAPFHVDRLLWSSVSQWTDAMHATFQYVHILSGVLFYFSSAVNPLIYSLLSTRFRECFRGLVCIQAARTSPPPAPKTLKSSYTLGSHDSNRAGPGAQPPSSVSNGCWDHDDEKMYV